MGFFCTHFQQFEAAQTRRHTMTTMRHPWSIHSIGALAAFALALSACSPPANQAVKPGTEKPVAEKPAADKPSGEKPAEKPTDKRAETKVSLQAVDLTSFQRILGMHKGKVVLVDFWATWCEPCKELFPHTVEVSRKYAAKDLTVVTMSFDDGADDEDKASALKFLTESKAGTTVNLISSLDTATSFDAYKIPGGAIPFFQLYDREGKLRHTFKVSPLTGPIDPAEIDLKIRELVMEKDPPAK